MKRLLLVAVAVCAGAGYKYRSPLRRWGLRTLAGNSPVMMNVTIDNGTVMVSGCTFGYFYRNRLLRSPATEESVSDLRLAT